MRVFHSIFEPTLGPDIDIWRGRLGDLTWGTILPGCWHSGFVMLIADRADCRHEHAFHLPRIPISA